MSEKDLDTAVYHLGQIHERKTKIARARNAEILEYVTTQLRDLCEENITLRNLINDLDKERYRKAAIQERIMPGVPTSNNRKISN